MLIDIRGHVLFYVACLHIVWTGSIMNETVMSTFRLTQEDRRMLDSVVAYFNRTVRTDSFLRKINRSDALRNLIAVKYAEVVEEERKADLCVKRVKAKYKRKPAESVA